MSELTRRRFLAGLATLPFVVKGFVMPSQATVAEFQAAPIAPVQPVGGTFRFMGKVIPWNATPEEMAEILSDKHCKVTAKDQSLIIEFIGGN